MVSSHVGRPFAAAAVRRLRPALRGAFAVALLALAGSRPARACSMCRCGDPTFSVLGTGVYSAGRFRLALDWDRLDKESGGVEPVEAARASRVRALHAEAAAQDREVEHRLTATLAYSFGERVTAVVRVPWSRRDLTTTGAGGFSSATTTDGLSDPEVQLLVRLWAAPLAADVGRKAWVSLTGGVKTPWGRNALSEGGTRLDEHAQPGTGSTDAYGGVSAFYLVDAASSYFGSVQYRATGSNGYGYRYGNVALADVSYERKLSQVVDAVVSLDFRHAERDRVDAGGELDADTGGSVLYVSPRVVVDLGRGLVARATLQLPVVKNLFGEQTEKAVVNAGLSYLF